MPPPTLYLETSVWGSLAPRQPRDRAQVVHRLLGLLDGVRAQCVLSEMVLTEIKKAPSDEVDRILECIERGQYVVHPISEAIETLALAYIRANVLPENRAADAVHVAVATCVQVDFLVSWNHRHMTRPQKRLQYQAVNQLQGYLSTPRNCNPFEACDEIRD